MILVLSSSKACICLITLLLSLLWPHSSPPFELLLSMALSFFYHLSQIPVCSRSWSDDPALHSSWASFGVGITWWWCWRTGDIPQRRWGMTASIVMRSAERWEKEVSPNKVERGRVCRSGGGPVRHHEIKLSSRCWLYTTVRLERDKHCLGETVCACGQNSGLWIFVAQRSVETSHGVFPMDLLCWFWMAL